MKNSFKGIHLELLAAFILLLLALIAYRGLPSCGFINFDDNLYVTDNYHVKTGVTLANIKWALVTSHAFNWHPVTWFSHMLDVELYGLKAGCHHMTNLLFHILNAFLLLFWLSKYSRKFWPSCFVATLFLLHPLHVESVAWISERKDVLSTFFWLLTMWCYTGYLSYPGKFRYLMIPFVFMIGLMSKPMLVTLPFVLLLLDYWPLNRTGFLDIKSDFKIDGKRVSVAGLVWEKIPLFILSAIACIVTFLVQRSTGAIESVVDFPLHLRFVNASIAYVGYIFKTIWPFGLAVFYPYPDGYSWWAITAAVFFLFMTSMIVIIYRKQMPWLPVGWFWYLGTLIPVIGLVQVGAQSMADRYTYIPLIGLFIIMAWGGYTIASSHIGYGKFPALIGCAFILFCSVRTNVQVQYWKDSFSLFSQAMRVTSNNALAYNNYGMALAEQGRMEEAVPNFQMAIKIDHKFETAYNNLGAAMIRQGHMKEAMEYLKTALILRPEYADAENNMGIVLDKSGKTFDAIKHFEKALILEPSNVNAHNNLGALLIRQNKDYEAMDHYSKILKFDPENANANNNFGTLLARHGKMDQAVKHFKAAVRHNPENRTMKRNLEKALLELKHKTENKL